MFAQIWGVLKFLKELWDALKVFIGMVEKAKHDKTQDEIKDAAGRAGNPDLSDEERSDATEDLEDIANRHARK